MEAVVLNVDAENEKISLSMKHLGEDPYRKYRVGAVVTGVVQRVVDFGAFVELEPGVEALLRSQEVSRHGREGEKEITLSPGQTVEAKVIKSDPREHKIDISVKKLEHEQERELVKKYVNRKDRPTLGDVLQEDGDEEHHEK